MVELDRLNMVVDKLVQCMTMLYDDCMTMYDDVGKDCSWLDERTDLNNVVGTIVINQQPCSYMIEHVVRE